MNYSDYYSGGGSQPYREGMDDAWNNQYGQWANQNWQGGGQAQYQRPLSPMYPNQTRVPGQYQQQQQPQRYLRQGYAQPHYGGGMGGYSGGRYGGVADTGPRPQPGYHPPGGFGSKPPGYGMYGGGHQLRKRGARNTGKVMPYDPNQNRNVPYGGGMYAPQQSPYQYGY